MVPACGDTSPLRFSEQEVRAGGVDVWVPELELVECDTVAALEQAAIIAACDGVVCVTLRCGPCRRVNM